MGLHKKSRDFTKNIKRKKDEGLGKILLKRNQKEHRKMIQQQSQIRDVISQCSEYIFLLYNKPNPVSVGSLGSMTRKKNSEKNKEKERDQDIVGKTS